MPQLDSYAIFFLNALFLPANRHTTRPDQLTEFSLFQAFDNLIKTDRLDMRNTDVQPYIVDGVTYLCELNHGIRRHYYYAPVYGHDVPAWQPRGPNPRSGKKLDGIPFSAFDLWSGC